MKALTIWQPWASLIAAGGKRYETRSWATGHRGELAIHAAKRWEKDQRDLMTLLGSLDPGKFFDVPAAPPAGVVLCVARLVEVVPVDQNFESGLGRFERAAGDFSPGRFAWELEIVEVFVEPVPARGRQRLWEWERP